MTENVHHKDTTLKLTKEMYWEGLRKFIRLSRLETVKGNAMPHQVLRKKGIVLQWNLPERPPLISDHLS